MEIVIKMSRKCIDHDRTIPHFISDEFHRAIIIYDTIIRIIYRYFRNPDIISEICSNIEIPTSCSIIHCFFPEEYWYFIIYHMKTSYGFPVVIPCCIFNIVIIMKHCCIVRDNDVPLPCIHFCIHHRFVMKMYLIERIVHFNRNHKEIVCKIRNEFKIFSCCR